MIRFLFSTYLCTMALVTMALTDKESGLDRDAVQLCPVTDEEYNKE